MIHISALPADKEFLLVAESVLIVQIGTAAFAESEYHAAFVCFDGERIAAEFALPFPCLFVDPLMVFFAYGTFHFPLDFSEKKAAYPVFP